MNLNQVTFPSTDVARSIAFYRKLGFRLIVEDLPKYARFECGGNGSTFSMHLADRVVPDSGVVVYFECEDLDATVERLRAVGIEFDVLPRDQEWLWREAHLRDPDGNVLCLYRPGANRRFPPWRIPNDAEDARDAEEGPLRYTLTVEPSPNLADVEVLRSGLGDHALPATGVAGFHDVAIFARTADGTIVGGAMALINWSWVYLALLWVAPSLRKTGLGHTLLEGIEAVGVDAGCTDVHLDTFSFQARPFYEQHGYEVFAALDRYPERHARYFMRKRLAAGSTRG